MFIRTESCTRFRGADMKWGPTMVKRGTMQIGALALSLALFGAFFAAGTSGSNAATSTASVGAIGQQECCNH